MNRNIVTGGAGFLGSHLIDRLMEAGEHVVCIDNLSTGRKQNISAWIDHPRFEFIEHDVINAIDINADRIWHLACPASPPQYQKDPIHTAKTCFMGTLNMLELSKCYNAKLLFASTSEVYGDPEIHPQPETYRGCVNTTGIRSCYDEGKRLAETLCSDYRIKNGLDVKIARIFNTYGPRMSANDGRVVSNFIVQALSGVPLTLYGNGEQTRSFCYVDDLIDGLWRLMNAEHMGPINLGNPAEFTIRQLAHKVIQLTGSDTELCTFPLPSDDPCQRRPVIELARSALDWEPKTDLDSGLKSTIQYFITSLTS